MFPPVIGGEEPGSTFAGNAYRAVLDLDCNRFGHRLCVSVVVNEIKINGTKMGAGFSFYQ